MRGSEHGQKRVAQRVVEQVEVRLAGRVSVSVRVRLRVRVTLRAGPAAAMADAVNCAEHENCMSPPYISAIATVEAVSLAPKAALSFVASAS